MPDGRLGDAEVPGELALGRQSRVGARAVPFGPCQDERRERPAPERRVIGRMVRWAVTVSFGGHQAAFLLDTPTRIVLGSPPGAAGTVQVTVTVGGVSSQATPAGLFTYQPVPLLP